jgi:hypothetical protein
VIFTARLPGNAMEADPVFAYLTRTRLAALACGYAVGRRDPARGIRVHARRPADPARLTELAATHGIRILHPPQSQHEGGWPARPTFQRRDPGPRAGGSPPLDAQPATSRWPDIQAAQHRKATHMATPATGPPRHPLIRWATAPFRVVRYLNQELLAAGEAMVGSNRFPQPRPQAGPVQVEHAPVSKVPTRD